MTDTPAGMIEVTQVSLSADEVEVLERAGTIVYHASALVGLLAGEQEGALSARGTLGDIIRRARNAPSTYIKVADGAYGFVAGGL